MIRLRTVSPFWRFADLSESIKGGAGCAIGVVLRNNSAREMKSPIMDDVGDIVHQLRGSSSL